MSVISAPGSRRQEDHGFWARLGYTKTKKFFLNTIIKIMTKSLLTL